MGRITLRGHGGWEAVEVCGCSWKAQEGLCQGEETKAGHGQEGKPPRERSGPAVRLSRDKGMAWGQQPVTEAGMLRRQPGVAAEVQASLFSYYVLSGGPGPAVGLQVQQGLIMGMGSCNCGG